MALHKWRAGSPVQGRTGSNASVTLTQTILSAHCNCARTVYNLQLRGIKQTRESGFVCTFYQVYRAYFKPSLHLKMVITRSKPVLMRKRTDVCAIIWRFADPAEGFSGNCKVKISLPLWGIWTTAGQMAAGHPRANRGSADRGLCSRQGDEWWLQSKCQNYKLHPTLTQSSPKVYLHFHIECTLKYQCRGFSGQDEWPETHCWES